VCARNDSEQARQHRLTVAQLAAVLAVSVAVLLVLMFGGVKLCQRWRIQRLERAATFAPVRSTELAPMRFDELDDVQLIETVHLSEDEEGKKSDSEFEV
jgi:hypothetical protein